MSLWDQPPEHAPLLVIAIGNPARGDDGIGPALADRLQAWLASQPSTLSDQIEVLTAMQLSAEDVLDLTDRTHVLVIDAQATPSPHPAWTAVTAAPEGPAWTSHHLTPAHLLSLYTRLLQTAPPPCTVLSVPGLDFTLGAPLSEAARLQVDLAWRALQAWLAPQLAHPANTALSP